MILQLEVQKIYYPEYVLKTPGYMEFTAKVVKGYKDGDKVIDIFGKDELFVHGNMQFGVASLDHIYVECTPRFTKTKYDLHIENILGFVSATQLKDFDVLTKISRVGDASAKKIIQASYDYFHESIFVVLMESGIDIDYLVSDLFKHCFEGSKPLIRMSNTNIIKTNLIEYIKDHTEEIYGRFYPELLTRSGLKRSDMNILTKQYGLSFWLRMKMDPYQCLEHIPLAFAAVDNFARKYLGIKKDDERRFSGAFRSVLQEDEIRNKNVYTDKDILIEKTTKYINRKSQKLIPQSRILERINKEIAISSIKTRKIGDKTGVYTTKNYNLENEVIVNINKRLKKSYNNSKKLCDTYVEEFQKDSGITLNSEQIQAIYMTMDHNLSVLTGSPGTGKSLTIKAISYVYKKITNRYVTLAAPTGKAARRMEEVVKDSAHTLHRLFGIDDNNTKDNSQLRQIDTGLFIIDESSMVDLDMLNIILNNSSIDTKILFVGDYNQLPSIGKGLILQDLIDSHLVPTIELQSIYRQKTGNNIIVNSKHLNEGGVIGKDIKSDTDLSGDFFVFHINDEKRVLDTLEREVKRYLKLGKSIEDIQVLTPRKSGILGSINVNKFLQNIINPKTTSGIEISDYQQMHVGDKIVQIKNNYRVNVMNGETGIYNGYKTQDKDGTKVRYYMFNFNGKEIEYEEKELEEISLAYAITVHKSQGSEFDVCFFVGIDETLTGKNLLYTAITRAKEKMYLLGDMNKLNKMIQKNNKIVRNSAIIYGLNQLTKEAA